MTPPAPGWGVFSQSYARDGKRPVVRRADARRFTGIDAIDRPDVGVIVNPGGTHERFARERLARAAITVFPDNTRIFDQIIAGKADVMVTDGVEVDLQSRPHPGVLCPAEVGAPFTHFEKAWLLPRDARFAAVANRFIAAEIRNGDGPPDCARPCKPMATRASSPVLPGKGRRVQLAEVRQFCRNFAMIAASR